MNKLFLSHIILGGKDAIYSVSDEMDYKEAVEYQSSLMADGIFIDMLLPLKKDMCVYENQLIINKSALTGSRYEVNCFIYTKNANKAHSILKKYADALKVMVKEMEMELA